MTNVCLFHLVSAAGRIASNRSQVCKNGNISRYDAKTMKRQGRLSLIFVCIKLNMAIKISCMARPTSTKVKLASGRDEARDAEELVANGCSKSEEENLEAAQE